MNPLEHPDYMAAVAEERQARDAAFFGLPETVAGFECEPLTFWHVMCLRMMRSPLLYGGTPSPDQLAAFLWLVSVDWEPGAESKTRTAFLKRVRITLMMPRRPRLKCFERGWTNRASESLQRAAKALDDARKYVDNAFLDAPEGKNITTIEYYSSAASLCKFLWSEYGIPMDRALHIPMRQYYQLRRRSEEANSRGVSFTNPVSRVVLDRLLNEMNSQSHPE